MNFFKLGRGDFFGIIIPGAFLVANCIYLFNPETINEQNNTAFYSILICVSYIGGISLRLLNPDWLECLPPQFKRHWGQFPYINWYIDTHLNGLPNSFGDSLRSLLRNEFDENRSRISQANGKDFINYCKTVISFKSPYLHEGILHAEGFSRLLSGMGYALVICALLTFLKIVTILMHKSSGNARFFILLLFIYSAMSLFFKGHLRRGRAKEAVMVLEAYTLINMSDNNCTNSRQYFTNMKGSSED